MTNYMMPDILAMCADPNTPEHEIAQALWASWGYRPPDGTEFTRAYNNEVRKIRLAFERRALGLTPSDDDPPTAPR